MRLDREDFDLGMARLGNAFEKKYEAKTTDEWFKNIEYKTDNVFFQKAIDYCIQNRSTAPRLDYILKGIAQAKRNRMQKKKEAVGETCTRCYGSGWVLFRVKGQIGQYAKECGCGFKYLFKDVN